ncbi:hypothetical protein BMG03_01025 [Thioclava nitratireducens]|uniref:Uncharacterized protein n=1 Tax=Thioclava nitratireducens TaxID=1915078 RepID=A0ABN4XB88_9RHOB|nr:hypothetical protein [Thioclava nitratireducens]AQS46538.1 hypothetical protein BMG03_01025 [Thioclava nitratireducens]
MATKKKTAPALDLDRLRRLADDIEALHRTHFLDLVARLEAEEGMKFSNRAQGNTGCRMAGLSAVSTAGKHGALTNWANAARRALKGGV